MRNVQRFFYAILFIFGIGLPTAQATHIIGGELNYTCLGNDEYEITLTVFRDCFNGSPAAFFDDPASIGIFDAVNNFLLDELVIPFDPMINDTLDPVLSSECFIAPPDVCVHTTTYTATITLPFNPNGYILSYQRCCRNVTISNIVDPLDTGATYSVFISSKALEECNSNAKIQEWPPVYICANEPIFFDQSAIDIDGDSIVYRLCTPLEGASPVIPQPQPPNPPPYQEVTWIDPPYNVDNMLNAFPGDPLVINSETGFLSGTPNTIGQFVVGICIEEYRDGELLSINRRDFQYNVGECGQVISAFFAPEVQCDDLALTVENLSQDADDFIWFFNDPNNPGAFSTEVNPTYTYSEPGTYEVVLIAEPDAVCADTFSTFVSVYLNSIVPDFTYEFISCVDAIELQMLDLSVDPESEIVEWEWTLSSGQTSNQQNPIFTIIGDQDLIVTLTVTSELGCTATTSQIFPVATIDEEIAPDTLLCGGGFYALNPDFNPAYIYEWSPAGSLNDANDPNPVANPDTTTTYTVIITNAAGCELILETTITVPEPIVINLPQDSIICNAEVDLFAETDQGVEFIWATDPDFVDVIGTTQGITVTPVGATTYYVRVTDAFGCQADASITVTGTGAEVELELIPTDVSCNGFDDGSVEAVVTNGTEPIEYEWSNGATGAIIENLGSGVYSVTATDANGCSLSDSIEIFEPEAISLMLEPMTLSCFGDTDGSIMAMPSGGTEPYAYLWSNDETTATITDLAAGIYTVTITDANDCIVVDSAEITSPDLLTLEVETFDVSCNSFENGSAIGTATGGIMPYSFEWSDGSVSDGELNDLPAGDYSVTVLDNNGCTAEASFTINEPEELSYTAEVVAVPCEGEATGEITVEVEGGTEPYELEWSNSQTGTTITDLAAGIYGLTITDANDCVLTVELELGENPNPVVEGIEISPSCFNGMTGSATVTIDSDAAPFSIEWENGSTDSIQTGLAAGEYPVTVTDSNGCVSTTSAIVSEEPAQPCNAFVEQPISVFDGTDGVVAADPPADGTAPFTYEWDNGVADPVNAGLSAGVYGLTITDANGCQFICSVELENPSKLGDFVWFDDNENGIQDAGELGVEDIEVELSGTSNTGIAISLSTQTDADGNYLFDGIPSGTYQLRFSNLPLDFQFTTANTGFSDALDSDVVDADGNTDPFELLPEGACNLDFDAGIFTFCENLTFPGEVEGDEFLCGPGNDPSPIIEVTPPSGGSGDIEYLWMFSTSGGPFNPGTWTAIPNSNTANFDPGPIFETTFFVRCTRREGCTPFLETNIIVKEVGDDAVARIEGPATICVDETVTFQAEDNGPGATYSWNFGPNSSPQTAGTPTVNVSWSSFGVVTIELTVENNGCTSVAYMPVFITNSPIFCQNDGTPVQIDLSASDVAEGIQLDWTTNVDIPEGVYLVERSVDGQVFEVLDVMDDEGPKWVCVDKTPKQGYSYYRIQLESTTGERTFSNVVRMERFPENQLLTLYPNPTKDRIYVQLQETLESEAQLELYSPDGKLLHQFLAVPGTINDLSLEDLPAGIYFLQVRTDLMGQQRIYRIVKQ
jgi:PKD repeat protein